MTQALPALLGGTPIRTEPFSPHTTMLGSEEKAAVLAVLDDGELSGFSGRAGARFLGGTQVRALEAAVCERFGVRHAISMNSATSALHAAVAAAGIGPGDEVITSPYTMTASPSSVLMANAVPVFADIEADTFGLDPRSVRERITPRTRAIMTVNLFGHPSRLDELRELADEHRLVLIEDNAQAVGARYRGRWAGGVGEMGIFSLNYHKIIQCGEGGLVVTDDDELAERCQLIRNHGEMVAPDVGRSQMENQLSWNYRLSELQAAVAVPQVAKLDALLEVRRELAGVLDELLEVAPFIRRPRVEPDCSHTYYFYTMTLDTARAPLSRQTLAAALQAEGFPIAEGYQKPLYLHAMYQNQLAYTRGCPFTCGHYDGDVSYAPGLCPVTERLYDQELFTTDICKYPNRPDDVRDFGRALEKIATHADALERAASS